MSGWRHQSAYKFEQEMDDDERVPALEIFLPFSHEFSDRFRGHLNFGNEWIVDENPKTHDGTAKM